MRSYKLKHNQHTGVSTPARPAGGFASRTSPSIPPKAGQKSFPLSHLAKIETVYGSRTHLKNNYEVSN
jgi:hypothetical protein